MVGARAGMGLARAAAAASVRGCAAGSRVRARGAGEVSLAVIPRNQQVRRFGVKQNYYIEKWNGIRENTTKEFEVSSGNFTTVFLAAVGFPLAYYAMYKSEEAGRNNVGRTFNQEKIKTM